MDDGEVDLSSHLLFQNHENTDSFDEFLKNSTTCTHTHTCNPPGPATGVHTHTCLHTHTKVFTASEDDTGEGEEAKQPRKQLGNREAVRKYREKKKAHTAYLEEEVRKLRAANQQLLRKLQAQPALEAEVMRLRSLLYDIRGKINVEVSAFPFQKQCANGGLMCNDPTQCFNGDAEPVGWEESCGAAIVECQMNHETVNSMDVIGSMVPSASRSE